MRREEHEAERKLRALEEEHAETLEELALYKKFFEASLSMNVAAAGLKEAVAVREAINAVQTWCVRKSVDGHGGAALKALKRTSSDT